MLGFKTIDRIDLITINRQCRLELIVFKIHRLIIIKCNLNIIKLLNFLGGKNELRRAFRGYGKLQGYYDR